ncbi:benzoate 4-monooxygenase cytochrome P450, partial [Penicillium argentinense]
MESELIREEVGCKLQAILASRHVFSVRIRHQCRPLGGNSLHLSLPLELSPFPPKVLPGPIPTSFTNIWRMQDVFNGRCDVTHNKLHRKHGPAVRMGPNVLSLSDPNLISQVYNTKSPWLKSDMYNVNDVVVGGVRLKNLFSNQDEKWHSTYIRPVKNLYSMRKVQDVENNIDIIINLFSTSSGSSSPAQASRVRCLIGSTSVIAWDAMSQVTFSQSLGIIESGSDYKGFLGRSAKTLDYFAPICQIPLLDMLFDKNPIMRIGPPTFVWANIFSLEQLQKRYQDSNTTSHADFLSKSLEAKEKNPQLVDDNAVILYLLSNVLAGSDSTAGTICATIYYVLKHPNVYNKLCDELRTAQLCLTAQWKDIQGLKYLEAVMRESMRVNPGVGLMLERVVPNAGFTLPDGRFVPEGTVVGMNPWVINNNEEVFGAETEKFVPERWLQGPLESYKLIATLFSTFDMELPSLKHEWQLTNSWFIRHKDIPIRLTERVGSFHLL